MKFSKSQNYIWNKYFNTCLDMNLAFALETVCGRKSEEIEIQSRVMRFVSHFI